MALCPTCTHDLQALVEERAGLAEILAHCLERDAQITEQIDAILDGQHETHPVRPPGRL